MAKNVSFLLSDADEKHLTTIKQKTGLSDSDAVRQSLASERFVQEQLKAGSRFLVRKPNGKMFLVEFS